MPFPETQRVLYKKNPLRNVICQLCFPPILSIDSEMPAQFQECIRSSFPSFNETLEFQLPVQAGLNAPVPEQFANPEMNIFISLVNAFITIISFT